eukprot:12910525-Prorocentrum_lima.AAC.1
MPGINDEKSDIGWIVPSSTGGSGWKGDHPVTALCKSCEEEAGQESRGWKTSGTSHSTHH